MLKLQNISFENRVIVGINAIYVIVPFFLSAGSNIGYSWGTFLFWWSILLINGLFYWIISGYKKQKGTKFSFMLKIIIASWFWIFIFIADLIK